MKILNQNLTELANKYKEKYIEGKPFPHIYFDNFFNVDFLDKVLEEFPDLSKRNSQKYNNVNEIKLAVQINGKTRDIISIKKDLNEKKIRKIIMDQSKAKKYILDQKIVKTIFVKNKIVNYII